MKSSIFIAIVLISGAFAGLVQSGTNFVLVEPILDDAIEIENRDLFESGEQKNTPEFQAEYSSFRDWQKGGQFLAGVILGVSTGALFGIVYALSRNSLPGGHDVKKALVLAGIMWLVLFLVPFLKYPANPPAVGEGDTVAIRGAMFLAFTAISGFAAVGFYRFSKILQGRTKIITAIGYGAFIAMVAFVMPDNPDDITVTDLIEEFRIMSILGTSSFWIAMPLILGALWNKFRPDKQIHETTP